MHTGFISPYADDHTRATPRGIIKQAEDQETRLKDWAYEIRQIADRMAVATVPSVPYFTPRAVCLLLYEIADRAWHHTDSIHGVKAADEMHDLITAFAKEVERYIPAPSIPSSSSLARRIAERVAMLAAARMNSVVNGAKTWSQIEPEFAAIVESELTATPGIRAGKTYTRPSFSIEIDDKQDHDD